MHKKASYTLKSLIAASHDCCIELCMCVLNMDSLIVFVHLWKVVAVVVQVCAYRVPPDWEVLFQSSSKVSAVRSWLGHQFVKGSIASFPRGSLDSEEGCERESEWKSQEPAMSRTSNHRAHQHHRTSPPNSSVHHELP